MLIRSQSGRVFSMCDTQNTHDGIKKVVQNKKGKKDRVINFSYIILEDTKLTLMGKNILCCTSMFYYDLS